MKDINLTYDLSQSEYSIRDMLKTLDEESIDINIEAPKQNHEIMLLIAGQIERVTLSPGEVCHLGRFEENTNYQIDLDPYDALKRGVSRTHASLFIKNNQVYIIDNGSSNGTHVGGQRIYPNEPTLVEKGSNVMLGLLRIKVMYQ